MQLNGSGGGSVGRAVASDTRDPRFESQHWQNFTYHLCIEIEKPIIKEKRPGMANLKKGMQSISPLLTPSVHLPRGGCPELLRQRGRRPSTP